VAPLTFVRGPVRLVMSGCRSVSQFPMAPAHGAARFTVLNHPVRLYGCGVSGLRLTFPTIFGVGPSYRFSG